MEMDKDQEKLETDIRSDLWLTMSVAQLNNQRELILDKITTTLALGSHPTALSIHAALQMALTDINNLIDSRMTKKVTL